MAKATIFLHLALVFPFCFLLAQKPKALPIIDMHLHAMAANAQGPPPLKMRTSVVNFSYHDPKESWLSAVIKLMKSGSTDDRVVSSPLTDDSLRLQTLRILKENNIYAVTSGDVAMVRRWHNDDPERVINAVLWNFTSAKQKGLTVDSLRKLFESGEFKVFGEVAIQYEGYSPSDTAFEPYLKMAEELDIPVAVHVGPGPPGAVYMGFSKYRASLHSAFVLEEALARHPKLRMYAMHAGWPLLDDMIATLYAHPQLCVDVGIIGYMLPEKEYYDYLHRLVNAGFGKRIMFGSDNMVWPGTIEIAISRINNATFLTEEQKRDILFNNAAKFLRLTSEQIKKMHGE